jgi:hypothetical protein
LPAAFADINLRKSGLHIASRREAPMTLAKIAAASRVTFAIEESIATGGGADRAVSLI